MKELSISTLSHYYIQQRVGTSPIHVHTSVSVASSCHYNQIASSLSLKWSCSLGIDHFGQEGEGGLIPNPTSGSKYNCLHHAYTYTCSTIWLELSNWRTTPFQSVKTSDLHFHMYEREGLGSLDPRPPPQLSSLAVRIMRYSYCKRQ